MDTLRKIAKVIEGRNFFSLHDPLVTLFPAKDVMFQMTPINHYRIRIKQGDKTIIILNKQDAPSPELTVGDVALGYIYNK